jgi:hypothetical protein
MRWVMIAALAAAVVVTGDAGAAGQRGPQGRGAPARGNVQHGYYHQPGYGHGYYPGRHYNYGYHRAPYHGWHYRYPGYYYGWRYRYPAYRYYGWRYPYPVYRYYVPQYLAAPAPYGAPLAEEPEEPEVELPTIRGGFGTPPWQR